MEGRRGGEAQGVADPKKCEVNLKYSFILLVKVRTEEGHLN
jgi:hypothetical protein